LEDRTLKYLTATVAVVAVALLVVNVTLMVPLYANVSLFQQGSTSTRPLILAESQLGEEANVIPVSGVGTVSAKPDEVQLSLGVETKATSATEAQQQNAEKMGLVVAALKSWVPEEDMKTTGFSLTPVWRYPDKEDGAVEIVGYICRNNVVVTLRDVGKTGELLDAAVSAGANVVSGISFTLSDEVSKQLQDEATRLAVKDAEAKANLVAEVAGVKIVGPKQISIGAAYVPYKALEAVAPLPTTIPTPILPGEVQVTVTVQVTYAFE